MKKQTRILTWLIGLGLLTVSFAAVGEENSPSLHTLESKTRDNEYVWLHVDGPYIRRSPSCTEPNGIWMGCGMATKCDIPSPTTAQAEYFARWCKSNHFNLVRIRWDVNNSASTIISIRIDPYLKALKALHIYSVLDCHSDMRDGWDVNNPTGRCKAWFDNWLAIAQYYKDEPWIMGYELNNEPQITSASKCRELYTKCIRNIRTVDRKHMIILGCYDWSHARARPPRGKPDYLLMNNSVLIRLTIRSCSVFMNIRRYMERTDLQRGRDIRCMPRLARATV